MKDFTVVILAAGLGKRMKSRLPKVLHPICGRPLVGHVVETARAAGFERIVVVVGHGAEMVRKALGDQVAYAVQAEQLGTGHALMCAREQVSTPHLMVLSGDAPLLRPTTLRELAGKHLTEQAGATVLTAEMDDPGYYGRIIREHGRVTKIVEARDASPAELANREFNTGTYCFERTVFDILGGTATGNAQGEYYLTDAVHAFRQRGATVSAIVLDDPAEGEAPNDRVQLAAVTAIVQKRILEQLMLDGVTMIDPSSTYVDAGVRVGADTTLLPGTIIKGNTEIGEECVIGPHTHIGDTKIANRVTIQHSVVLGAVIGDEATVGPFAYLRPETVLHPGAKIGDFVEVKKSVIGPGSKVPHLSYVGDATIGSHVNIGAGTITCNYDGVRKHQTVIEDGVFVGSNTNLVAPVTVGRDAVIGAGSTITKTVPPGGLAIARAHQLTKENYRRRRD